MVPVSQGYRQLFRKELRMRRAHGGDGDRETGAEASNSETRGGALRSETIGVHEKSRWRELEPVPHFFPMYTASCRRTHDVSRRGKLACTVRAWECGEVVRDELGSFMILMHQPFGRSREE